MITDKSSKVTRLVLVGFVTVVLFDGVCFGSRSGNLEYWQTNTVAFDISKHFAFTAAEELRTGRHNGNPYLHNVELGLVYKSLAEWVDIGLNFKKEYEKDSTGKFRQENRPHLNITFKDNISDYEVSDRVRLEYRNREKKEDLFRLRNKVAIKLPCKLTALNLQPYVAEEFFINLGENNINQNRLSSGFACKVTENLEASVYYMWKTSKITGGWEDTNVLGVALKLLF